MLTNIFSARHCAATVLTTQFLQCEADAVRAPPLNPIMHIPLIDLIQNSVVIAHACMCSVCIKCSTGVSYTNNSQLTQL